jgi:hypothetical protein
VQFGRACLCRYGCFLEERHVICLCTSDTVYTVYEKEWKLWAIFQACVCVCVCVCVCGWVGGQKTESSTLLCCLLAK